MAITKKSLVNSSKGAKLTPITKTTKISTPVAPAKMATALKAMKVTTAKLVNSKAIF